MSSRKLELFLTIICGIFIIVGLGCRIYADILSITNYPLATGWSESGRIFEAASVYSSIVFGKTLPWPWLDPGRAVLEGLAFLIPNSQIWMYRLWMVVFSLTAAVFSAFLVIQRAWNSSPGKEYKHMKVLLPVLLVSWGILYILQFPIQPHLLLGVIIVLWLFDLDKPIRSLLIVVIASAWEGLCRVNWFLMPAVLAISIYFLSVPIKGKKIVHYFSWPVIWCTGGILASLLTYGLFIKITNNIIPFFNSNMHYGFFRNRLWPNEGFRLGLIPGIILLSIPLVALIASTYSRIILKVHFLRLLALLSLLGIFFAGSTIVSMRAGGGFDLHNFDSFGLILFLIGCYFGLGALSLDKPEPDMPVMLLDNRLVLLGLLSVPLFFALGSKLAGINWPVQEAKNSIQRLQTIIRKTDTSKGPVLFIDDRHLLAYHMIRTEDLFIPYEKIELMEMAMANNNPYLNRFWKDVEAQKFSLIVSEKLQPARQDVNSPFGYENNVWVEGISDPILRYYQLIYNGSDIAVYAPTP